MMVILTLLYILSGFLFVILILGFINEYFEGKKKECEVVCTKDIIQGIKKRSVKNITKPTKKQKVTTDMIKVNGKTKIVKRDNKGHFTK